MTAPLGQRTSGTPPLRFSQLLGRLALAGLLAGLVASAWLLLVTERAIRPALALEEARQTAAGGGDAHEDLFSRTTQQVGGVLGTVLAGVALALVFAVVFALARHRLPGRTDLTRAMLLAAIGFGVVALLPAIKIPANPPAVGDPNTITTRTAIYGAVLLCGVVTVMLMAAVVSALQDRGTAPAATAAAATVLGVGLLVAVILLLPDSPDIIPDDVPAAVIWNFRLASLGQQAVLWTTLGLAGGWLLERRARERT